MGEIFNFLRYQGLGAPKAIRVSVSTHKKPLIKTHPYLWDELEAAKGRPCKVYLKSEIQEYITLHNPHPPIVTKRNSRSKSRVPRKLRKHGRVRD